MKWKDILYYDKSVVVREIVAKRTKKPHARKPDIPPCAMAWLRFCHSTYAENKEKEIIELSISYYYASVRRLVSRAGVTKWYKNILRHTYSSYGSNKFSLQYVAAQMGHYREISVLRDNYKHLTTKTDSDQLF